MPSPSITRQVSLAPFTTWKVGGPAEYFLEPETTEELREGLLWAKGQGMPVYFLGRGSNVLVADEGLHGLTVCLRKGLQDLVFDDDKNRIVAGAGVSLPKLSKFAAKQGWGGYEFLIGIPGTVGGGVVINAGYKRGDPRDIAHLCDAIQCMGPDGQTYWIDYSDLKPDYRRTDLSAGLRPGHMVTAATFKCIHKSSPATIRAATSEQLRMRKATQPLTVPTAGSVFVAHDGTPAAIYIDRAGLKGHQIGGARISPKHANWIENTGTASAADIKALIAHVQQTVQKEFGIQLTPEIRTLGGPSNS